MEFTVSQAGSSVPSGAYNSEFAGCEPFTENVEKFGEGVLLKWKILDGEHKDEIATRICSKKFSPKSNLFKFAKQLLGADLEVGAKFNFNQVVGTKGSLVVEEVENGTRVTTFLRQG